MPIKDIINKYPETKNKKVKQLVNYVIRQGLIGGDDCLDAMELCSNLWSSLERRNIAGADHARIALTELKKLREIFFEEIANRYDLKSAMKEGTDG